MRYLTPFGRFKLRKCRAAGSAGDLGGNPSARLVVDDILGLFGDFRPKLVTELATAMDGAMSA